MKGYEITERGKFVIVVLFVIVLIVLSFIISINEWGSNSTPDEPVEVANDTPDSSDDLADDPFGGIINAPTLGSDGQDDDPTEPGVIGLDEEEPGEDGNGGVSPPGVDGDETQDSGEHGLVGLDVDAGTMAFMFFHGTQTALDTHTASRLEDFLASPRNTPGARILVEMPELPDDGRSNVVNALTSELVELGVPRGNIVFFTVGSTPDGDSVEIRLSFQQNIGGGK